VSSFGPPWRRRAAIHLLFGLAVCSLRGQITQGVADELVPGTEQPPASDGTASYSKRISSDKPSRDSKPDFNRDIYYRNKLEFSFESGWLPNNIPLVFDFLVGSPYTLPGRCITRCNPTLPLCDGSWMT
jgi:hypothetical protein